MAAGAGDRQYFPLPAYPVRYANRVALGWLAAGVLAVAVAPRRILENVDRLFEGAIPVGPAGPDVPPEPLPVPAT
jgi:hypothetical protein